MCTYDAKMVFDHSDGTNKDRFTKKSPHTAPFGRAVPGGYIMSLGILAAYETLQPNFQIHRLTAQFFHPGAKDKTLSFHVARSSDRKNNAARIVSVSQKGVLISAMTMDFAQPPTSDGLSLNYQSRMPEGISSPVEGADDLKVAYEGLIHGQNIGRVMNSKSIVDNSTRQWLKVGNISPDAHLGMHHAGLAFLSDLFILDAPVRLLNLQLGLGELEVGPTQKDSPYDLQTTKDYSLMGDFRTGPPSDLKILMTLNHTIHFHNPSLVKADDWIFMDISTSYAHGRRALTHSKLFSRDGGLMAVCTQEGYYRFKDEVSAQKLRGSNL